MIHNILQVVAKDLNTFLQMRFQYSEDIVVLSELMNNADGSFAVAGENKMVCTLMNVEQERLHANSPMGTKAMFNPPFNLNLYVLFSAFYTPANYIPNAKPTHPLRSHRLGLPRARLRRPAQFFCELSTAE